MLFPFVHLPKTGPRVVVTGLGLITPLASGAAAHTDPLRAGRTAFRPITVFDASRQRVRFAGETDLPPIPPGIDILPPAQIDRLDRAGRFLLFATHEAWGQSGWSATDPTRMVLGTTGGGMSLGEAYYRTAIQHPDARRRQPSRALGYHPHRQAAEVARALGIDGPITIIANACASGSNAIGHAADLIRTGQETRVLAGGYDSIAQLVFAGFDSLQALSPTGCRPFDVRRDGLSLGEGAAVLALESADSARARGARALGEIAGYGAATDVHHLTQPHPDGIAAFASMTAACRQAGVAPQDIQYVNAHGTGTPLNDSAEAAAIDRWAGARAGSIQVSSTKAGMGHLLGAAGAVEAGICLLALRGQWIPPMPGSTQPDPLCSFPLVTVPQTAALSHVLSNSFGFGGANASLVFRDCE